MAGEVAFRRVDAARLEKLVAALYARAGMPEADAARLSDALVDADLRGVHSHGCRWVAPYLRGIAQGSLNTHPKVEVVRDDGATLLLDADFGVGHVVVYQAMELAVERARSYGTGTVLVRRSTHCGALAYFTQRAADAGCLGYATTNAGIGMIPTGGREKVCGLNPLSWAAPTGQPWAIDLDMATSVVAGSKLGMAKERGEPIPLGWALDPDGNPTSDPDLGMKGGILPIGGPKGYGLSVMLDVMSGVLSGGRFGRGLGQRGCAQFVQAIDVEHFIPLGEFKARMEALIAEIKGSALAPGSPGIFLPGEIEHLLKKERLANGLPLDGFVRGEIRREAEAAGLPYDVELD